MKLEIVISQLESAFDLFGFQYACLGDPELGVIWERGCLEDLDGSDLPHNLFGDLEAINGVIEYLEENKPPRMMSQGNTRSVMGLLACQGKKFPYSFFADTSRSVIEHYAFAKKVDAWLQEQSQGQ